MEKGHETCADCADFACELLKEFAYDKNQGDDGERIENLKAWKQMGFGAWVAARNT